MFVDLWAAGLREYDGLKGRDWEWQAMDGAMTKAPLGGERTGRNPTDRGKLGRSGLLTSGFPEIGTVKRSCSLSLVTRPPAVGYDYIRSRSVTSQAYWTEG